MKKFLILIFSISLLSAFFFGGGGGDDDSGDSEGNLTFNAVDYIPIDSCDAKNDWDDNLTTKIVGKEFNLSILSLKDGEDTEANISRVDLYEYNESNCSGDYITQNICEGDSCGQTNSNGCLTLENVEINRSAKCVKVHIEGNVSGSSSDGGGGGGWFF